MPSSQITIPMHVEASNSAGGGVLSAEVAAVAQFIAMLQDATPAQAADILSVLDRGLPLWTSRKEGAVPETTPVKAKKAVAKKEKPAPAALPEAAGSSAPDASDYRIDASSIDETLCVARNLKGGEDKRWKPIIYRESQCGGKRIEGSDLCTKCSKREEKYAETSKPGDWNGRITEEPEAWVHMLGTTWAEEKGCKFVASQSPHASSAGSVADAAEVASENGCSEEMLEPVGTAKTSKATSKAAAKEAEKAEKAAKAAAKEAEKAAKAAAKEAEKAAKAAAKEAEKLAKAAAKPAAKPAAAPKSKPEAKKPVAEKNPVVEVQGELKLIDGTLYMVTNGNVYEYDEDLEKVTDFVGRFTADETIDTEAEEVTAAESDSD